MKTSLKTILGFSLFATVFLLLGHVFAGPVVGDIPVDENEVRTISGANTIYAGLCDISQNLALYDGSPVYLRVAQPKTVVNYVFDKTITYVRVYGGNLFSGALKFPYISNLIPSTTLDTANTNILSVVAKDATFLAQPSTPRNKIAGQFVTKNMLRSLVLSNAGSTINYYFRYANDNSYHDGTLKAIINPTATEKTTCTNYYIARCGDSVVDTAAGTSDGAGGIQTETAGFLPRLSLSIMPAEQCDDGNTVSGDGCSSTCQNEGAVTPTCTSLTINPTTGTTTTTYNFNCAGTNATSYQISITNNGTPVAGTPLQYTGAGPFVTTGFGPLPAGNNIVTCTVFGGNTSNSCHNQTVQVGTINQNTTLQITKTLVPNPLVPDGKYRPGDTVTFRIDFKNVGTNPATNARVRDVFPNSLIHIITGDQLIGVQPPYNYGIYSNGTNEVIEYSGFYLPAGAAGYMIVKGIAQGYEWANQTYNHAYIISDNATIKDAHLYFDYAIPNANVTINKTLNTAGPFYPGSTFGFTLTLQNNGDTVNNIQIQDLWPSTPCIIPSNTYISNMSLQSNGNYSWTLNGAFNQGQTITINMTGQILNDPVCAAVGSYINKGTYSYVLVGITHTGSASAVIPVAPTPYANIDFQKTILQAGSKKGDTVSYKITYKNNGTNPLSSFVVTDFWPATLNYVSASPLPFNPPLGNSCAQGCSLNRYINATLQPGAVGEIVLTGTIK